MIQLEDNRQWVERQFGGCQLGDQRRTKRLVTVTQSILDNPSASLPTQNPNWGDLKAAYRLFDCEQVSFSAIASPHWAQTRQQPPGTYLIISDTTELIFKHPHTTGLGPTGNGSTNGLLLHNALMVEAASKEILGLAGQLVYFRKPARKGESSAAKRKRPRESELWGKLVDQIGSPAEGVRYIHLFDRKGDDFEALCHMRETHTDWVVRGSRMSRKIIDERGKTVSLSQAVKAMPCVGSYELNLRARPQKRAHTANLDVHVGTVCFPVPKVKSVYVAELKPQPICMSVVWLHQTNASKNEKPIEWVLLTSLPVKSFEDAWQVIEYYEGRWLVEEFHKSLKTGCSVESRQLQDSSRLEPLVGLLSVVAVRLVQLKTIARHQPDRPADGTVPRVLIDVLAKVRPRLKKETLTVYQFIRAVAMLGGFIGRKSDGEPGWQTIWRGWQKLHLLQQGYSLATGGTYG